MKRFLLIFAVSALAISPFFARDPQDIVDIRTRYQSVSESIRQNTLYVIEVKRNATDMPMPGTGHNVETIRFYVDLGSMENDDEPILVKIESTQEIAAMEIYDEYLFDTARRLIFCYRRARSTVEENGIRSEIRFYFKNGNVIRAMDGTDLVDVNNPEVREGANNIRETVKYLRELFELAD